MLDEVLGSALKDNVKARRLQPDGSYVPVPLQLDGQTVRSQMVLLELRAAATEASRPLPAAPTRRSGATSASAVEKDKAEKAGGTGTAG